MKPAPLPPVSSSPVPRPHRLRRRGSSLRTQLIAWNILALAVLLGALGFVIRYTVSSFLMASINQELERQERRLAWFGRGGPHGDRGPGIPGGPRFVFGSVSGDDHPPDGDTPPPSSIRIFRGSREKGERGFRGGGGGGSFSVGGPMPPPGIGGPFGQGMGGPNGPGGPPPGNAFLHRFEDAYGPRQFDLDGTPFGDRKVVLDATGLSIAKQGKEHYSTVEIDGEPVRVLSVPLYDRTQIIGVGQAGYPVTEVYRAMSVLDTALLTLTPVALLFAGLGGAYLTDRVLRRVRRTTEAAERISVDDGRGDFSARLPVIGDDEFSQLAETFNGLLGRLENAFQIQVRALDQQRRLTADASHELKTPLTVIRGTASLALSREVVSPAEYRRSLQDIDRAAETMSDLVQDLLLLARSDAGQLGKERIEMLVREVLEQAIVGVVAARAHTVSLRVSDELLTVWGNEMELVRLFTNLLDNAARYTPAPGSITLTASPEGADRVTIRIIDSGVGIAPEHLPHLGERFYRVDSARARQDGGTGLGLSICQGIVEAHHGTIRFDSRPDQGTMVTVSLPRAG